MAGIRWRHRKKKALHLARQFEPPHRVLPLTRAWVGQLGAVVQALVLTILDTGYRHFLGGGVGLEFVGDHHLRDEAETLEGSGRTPGTTAGWFRKSRRCSWRQAVRRCPESCGMCAHAPQKKRTQIEVAGIVGDSSTCGGVEGTKTEPLEILWATFFGVVAGRTSNDLIGTS